MSGPYRTSAGKPEPEPALIVRRQPVMDALMQLGAACAHSGAGGPAVELPPHAFAALLSELGSRVSYGTPSPSIGNAVCLITPNGSFMPVTASKGDSDV